MLSRPRFATPPAKADEILRQPEADGERVAAAPVERTLPDPDDRAFIEVALSGHANALVTGKARHFPPELGIVVLSPRALLERIDPQ